MRLYLSAFQLGTAQNVLAQLIGANRRVAVIGNAMDEFPPEGRPSRIERQFASLSALDCQCEELDLRHYFGKTAALADRLSDFGMIWVHGGNSFVLKRAFEQSGCDGLLKDLLESDKIAYGGFSAALMMVMPSLHGIELCDDPATVPAGYDAAFNWESLGLIPYSILPHYRSNHPDAGAIEKAAAYMKEQGLPHRLLRDGEVIVVDENGDRVAGHPYNYFPGRTFGGGSS